MTIGDSSPPSAAAAPPSLEGVGDRLTSWLVNSAYPLWSRNGVDAANGGFIEALAPDGSPLPQPRRARVQPRQIYAFAQAPNFGWAVDVRPIVERGCDYFVTHYRRTDGLFRTLAAVDGSALDDRAVLYDQAFALLGFAAAAVLLDAVDAFEARALELREAIDRRLRSGAGAFYSDERRLAPFESNPHMHLLEACLAWAETGRDAGWSRWTHDLVDLALHRFIRRDSGALAECFAQDWTPAQGLAGRIIEPGHQFEWAWLLLRAETLHGGPVRAAALRLIDIGEHHGVHHEVAVNSLLDDLTVHDANARCWPQTERIKAALLAARITGESRYRDMAAAAAASLFPYLDTRVPGLWVDVRLPTGNVVDSPAPASTFYHLVGALAALHSCRR